MLGGCYWGDCHAQVFNELVLGFLYPGFFQRNNIPRDKLRIVIPLNYTSNGESTIDEVLETGGKQEVLGVFKSEYLEGHYSQKNFQKKISPFSHTYSFDGEVFYEHRTNSKKAFSLEVLSSI